MSDETSRKARKMARQAGASDIAVKKTSGITKAELVLDAAVEVTFPASDPISIDHAYKAASEDEQY